MTDEQDAGGEEQDRAEQRYQAAAAKFPEKALELKGLRQRNTALVQEINEMGCPPMSIADQRWALLIDVLLGEEGETEERMDFELAWEHRAATLLDQIKARWQQQVTRMKLMGGVPQQQMPPMQGRPGAAPTLVKP